MNVRRLRPGDEPQWLRMRIALWPRHSIEELRSEMKGILANAPREAVFVAEEHDGGLCGFAEVSLKESAPGCATRPIGYLEAWYVDPDQRGHGVGRLLVDAAESWAREQGCQEMASDAESDNTVSRKSHAALGFEEVECLAHFRKRVAEE